MYKMFPYYRYIQIFSYNRNIFLYVKNVEIRELTVNFKYENNNYNNIWLSGEALMVYLGEIEC